MMSEKSIGEKQADLTFSTYKLSYREILLHFEETKNDFAPQTKEFLLQYATKLSSFANFVTIRSTKDNKIYGLIAYYANSIPNIFLTRVWVSKSIRGLGWCRRMIDFIVANYHDSQFNCLKLEVRKDNISAIKSYKSQGFIKVNENESKILMIKHINS